MKRSTTRKIAEKKWLGPLSFLRNRLTEVKEQLVPLLKRTVAEVENDRDTVSVRSEAVAGHKAPRRRVVSHCPNEDFLTEGGFSPQTSARQTLRQESGTGCVVINAHNATVSKHNKNNKKRWWREGEEERLVGG